MAESPEELDLQAPGADAAATAEAEAGSIVARISRDIVRIHAQFYGRGPTKSKTLYREGIVSCILGEIFTTAEATLVEAGQFEQVRGSRQAFQDTVEPLLRQAVEEATGRRTMAFLSQISENGYGAEIFVLAPSEPAER